MYPHDKLRGKRRCKNTEGPTEDKYVNMLTTEKEQEEGWGRLPGSTQSTIISCHLS